MNKRYDNLALLGIFLVAMLLVSITIAAAKSENSGGSGNSGSGGGSSGNSGSSGGSGNSGKSENSGSSGNSGKGNSGNSGSSSNSGSGSTNSGPGNSGSKSIKGMVQSELEIEEESGKLKVTLSNGNKKNLDVDPDWATSIAFDALKSDTFNITLNQSGELVEYEAVAFKNGKFLWLFNSEVKIKASIDETGNISIDKPWWAFLVAGEDGDESNSTKVTVCHIPPGNPANKHTISIGSPALKAHLKHGDSVGACEGEESPGNDTNVTNQTNQTTPSNLSITLIEPQNGSIHNTTTIPLQFTFLNDSLVECFYGLDSDNETMISECSNTSFNTTEGNHTIFLRINEGNNTALSNTHWFSVALPVFNETNSTNNETNNTA